VDVVGKKFHLDIYYGTKSTAVLNTNVSDEGSACAMSYPSRGTWLLTFNAQDNGGGQMHFALSMTVPIC